MEKFIKPSENYESRIYDARFSVEEESGDVVGYAAVFNKFSRDLGGFIEIIERGAFSDVLGDDVVALFNHSPDNILGRTTSGTVEIWQDDEGLGYRIKLPDTSLGNDMKKLIARGDITTSSFGFDLSRDGSQWEQDEDGRAVHRIKKVSRLWDVSPVTWAAYPDTSVSTAGYKRFLANREESERAEYQRQMDWIARELALKEKELIY